MPRPRRSRTYAGDAARGLTYSEKEALRFGMILLNSNEFTFAGSIEWARSAAAALKWRKHRRALLAACEPGTRPFAFWFHDCGSKDPPSEWWRQVDTLEKLGLLSDAERLQVEKAHWELAPSESRSEGFNARHYAISLRGLEGGWREMKVQAQFVARWHRKAGRRALAAEWEERIEILDAAMKGVTYA